jgi:hypothetical protein
MEDEHPCLDIGGGVSTAKNSGKCLGINSTSPPYDGSG